MTWWVLTYHDHTRSLHHLHVVIRTNHRAHLFMAWSRYEPARTPIYRTVRGKRIFCGYRIKWNTPNLTEQNESLYTYYHTFGPITLASTDHVWYFLSSVRTQYERYCQSALFHVWPPELHTWTTKAFVGTSLKGIYYTETFTGPGGTHPVWWPVNEGLHSLVIWQLHRPPLGLAYRMYAIAGVPGDRTLYVRTPVLTPSWLELLTNAAAVTLTGSTSGEITWVASNTYFPGHLYVLFNSALTDNGTWCIRSLDYGQTWTAHQIYAGIQNYEAGNISVGLTQGASPHDPGTVLYAALCSGIGARANIWLSLDHGQTWARQDFQGLGLLTPRCLVDPTDQSTVYIGAVRNIGNVRELWRSVTHGTNLVEVDGLYHLGLIISPYVQDVWVNPTDHAFLTALSNNHLYITIDDCVSWTDTGLIAQTVKRFALLWEIPDHFYLARNVSGNPGPPHSLCHVIFASEDYGATMYGKAGQWACSPTGHGDSIPYNCGGVCLQGLQLFPPY